MRWVRLGNEDVLGKTMALMNEWLIGGYFELDPGHGNALRLNGVLLNSVGILND